MAGIGALGPSVYQQSYYLSNIAKARSAGVNPAQPETPVEPVDEVRPVAPDASVRQPVAVQETRVPSEEDLNNASDNLARMRIEYAEESAPAEEQPASQSENNNYLTNVAGIS